MKHTTTGDSRKSQTGEMLKDLVDFGIGLGRDLSGATTFRKSLKSTTVMAVGESRVKSGPLEWADSRLRL